MKRSPHRIGISFLLCLGLLAAGAPGYGQETEELQTTAGKKKHRKRQNRPVKLGTSGGNANDFTEDGFRRLCCAGTLGALVEKFGVQYILSNNHVLARSNSGRSGEAILQPGLIDQSCPASEEEMDTVAHLSAKKKVKFGLQRQNKVDLAIAEVVPGAVKSDGEIVQIGVPGATPAEAFVGMEIKKGGRTTGLTRGVVIAVRATVVVPEFPLECGGSETRSARFVNQIFISSVDGKKFLDGGDSGSMVYRDEAECPAPVGLLFAGSRTLGAASPAATVLKTVRKLKPRGDARFVGCESSRFEATSARAPILRPQRVREASGVLRAWEDRLLNTEGVHGVGIGVTLSGPVAPAIYVFSTDRPSEVLERLPETVGDFRVEVIETDEFVAYCGQPGSG